jgi:hypothetical protein
MELRTAGRIRLARNLFNYLVRRGRDPCAVRHAELAARIGSRALKPVEGIDDADMARRVHRLA